MKAAIIPGDLLKEPFNFQEKKLMYYGGKTKKAAQRIQRQRKVAQNARRHQGTCALAKGYNNLPHDSAEKVKSIERFVPTIFINTMEANEQFDKDFSFEEREHGFMVSCKGVVLFWNANKKDFGTELVELQN